MGRKVTMSLWAFGLVILLVIMSNAKSVNGISCGEAISTLQPCLSFVIGIDPSPSAPCCLAVDTLNKQAVTKEIRQELCQCFKQAASSIGVNLEKARQIPALCHVQVPVPIDPNVDCTKISSIGKIA